MKYEIHMIKFILMHERNIPPEFKKILLRYKTFRTILRDRLDVATFNVEQEYGSGCVLQAIKKCWQYQNPNQEIPLEFLLEYHQAFPTASVKTYQHTRVFQLMLKHLNMKISKIYGSDNIVQGVEFSNNTSIQPIVVNQEEMDYSKLTSSEAQGFSMALLSMHNLTDPQRGHMIGIVGDGQGFNGEEEIDWYTEFIHPEVCVKNALYFFEAV